MRVLAILCVIAMASSAAPLNATDGELVSREEKIYTTIRPNNGRCRFWVQLWRSAGETTHHARISISNNGISNNLAQDAGDTTFSRWANDERGIFLVPIADNVATIKHVGVYGDSMDITWKEDARNPYAFGSALADWKDHLEFKYTGRNNNPATYSFTDTTDTKDVKCEAKKWGIQRAPADMVMKNHRCEIKC